ncbi:metalloregulator ArsR/SmtB family transcription factor [bacterium]|nr:metalloregulator ArsR/SmtB family transcription factor [bacterium]
MQKRKFKDTMYSGLAKIVKAMANQHRLEILDLLAQGEKSVEEIAAETSLNFANASQHLQTLKQNLIVQSRRDGHFVYYSLADDNIYRVWSSIREFGVEQVAELEKVIREKRQKSAGFQAYSLDEAMEKVSTKEAVLIDVRPASEYRHGHIEGSMSFPIQTLEENFDHLKQFKEVIVYCRGPFCMMADDAVNFLRAKGLRAMSMEKGYMDWKFKKN